MMRIFILTLFIGSSISVKTILAATSSDDGKKVILFLPASENTGVETGRVHVWGGVAQIPPFGSYQNNEKSFATLMSLEIPVTKHINIESGYMNFGHFKNHHADSFFSDATITLLSVGGNFIKIQAGAGGQLTYDTVDHQVDHVPGLNGKAQISVQLLQALALELGYLKTWNKEGPSPSIIGIGVAIDLKDDPAPGGNHMDIPQYTLSVTPGLYIENGAPNDRWLGARVATNGPIKGPLGYTVFILATSEDVVVAQQLRLSKRFGQIEIGGAAGIAEGSQGFGTVVSFDAKYWAEISGHFVALGFTVNRDWYDHQDHDFAGAEITTGLTDIREAFEAIANQVTGQN